MVNCTCFQKQNKRREILYLDSVPGSQQTFLKDANVFSSENKAFRFKRTAEWTMCRQDGEAANMLGIPCCSIYGLVTKTWRLLKLEGNLEVIWSIPSFSKVSNPSGFSWWRHLHKCLKWDYLGASCYIAGENACHSPSVVNRPCSLLLSPAANAVEDPWIQLECLINSVLTAFPTPHCWAYGPETSPIPTPTQSSQLTFAHLLPCSSIRMNSWWVISKCRVFSAPPCICPCSSVWDSSTSPAPPLAWVLALCPSPVSSVILGSLLPLLLHS